MPWYRDPRSRCSPGLGTLVVLGLVMTMVLAVVAETSLGGSTAAPSWRHLSTASSTAGSVLPPAGDFGAPALAAARKRKGHKLLAEAGLERCAFHVSRHTAVSLLIAEGVPLKVIQEVVGHSLLSTAADIYSHLFPQAFAEAADAMDRALG